MADFARWSQLTPETRVLDVGGTAINWSLLPVRPDLTLLNLSPTDSGHREVVADGTRLPFRDGAFDVVFSNSVIEHVADHEAFAAEVRRVGQSYFVQTPNRRFPLEPHMMMPLVNYLPKRWQRRLYRNFTPWGWITRGSQEWVDRFVEETNLLGPREVADLFPGAEVQSRRSVVARYET